MTNRQGGASRRKHIKKPPCTLMLIEALLFDTALTFKETMLPLTVFICLLIAAVSAQRVDDNLGLNVGIDPESFAEQLAGRINNALSNVPPNRNRRPYSQNPVIRPQVRTFTSADLQALETRLSDEITRNSERNLIAQWVRLAFHDCSGSGGCDGCIDTSDPKNRGSNIVLPQSRALYNEINPKVSFADFVALLGTVAAKRGAEAAGGSLNIPFSIGRKDCTQPSTERELPACNALNSIEFLSRKFVLSTEEAVALMGAHSLGGARANQSGFSGPWDRSPRVLDSAYYTALLQENWNLTTINNDRIRSTQWNAGNLMMLHADMIILKDFTTSSPNDRPSCTFMTCRDRPATSDHVRTFSSDQRYWHQVFSSAFQKMLSTGSYNLTPVY